MMPMSMMTSPNRRPLALMLAAPAYLEKAVIPPLTPMRTLTLTPTPTPTPTPTSGDANVIMKGWSGECTDGIDKRTRRLIRLR